MRGLVVRGGGIHRPGSMLRLCSSRSLRRAPFSLFHLQGFFALRRSASASCGSAGTATSGRSSMGLSADFAMSCESRRAGIAASVNPQPRQLARLSTQTLTP